MGESPTYAPMTYVFYSEEAREAYIQGINDAVGWMEAEPIEHDEPKKFSMNDFECLEPWLERAKLMKTSKNRGKSMKMKTINLDLLKAIVRQIEKDASLGDYTAIEELLNNIPIEKLKGFFIRYGQGLR